MIGKYFSHTYNFVNLNMQNKHLVFEVNYKDGKINIQRHLIANQTVYRILFSDKRTPLIITEALTNKDKHWWTSVPEGRQNEANEIGPLIAEYIQTNQS